MATRIVHFFEPPSPPFADGPALHRLQWSVCCLPRPPMSFEQMKSSPPHAISHDASVAAAAAWAAANASAAVVVGNPPWGI